MMCGLRWSAAACIALSAGTPALAQDVPPTTRILLLYEHAPESRSIAAFTHALRSGVVAETASHVEFREAFLDFARFPERERAPELVRAIAEQYRTTKPDVIVAEGSVARQFAMERLAATMPGVPVVFTLSTEPISSAASLPANVTGRFATLPFATTFAMARRLQPDAKRVVVIGGTSRADSIAVVAAVNAIAPQRGELLLDAVQGIAPNDLLWKLRRLPERSIVMLASFTDDEHGSVTPAASLVTAIARESTAPVYAGLDSWLGQGVVGGAMLQFADEGTRTARLVARVLRRASGERMPAAEIAATPLVADWRQLRRWKIAESALYPGTQVMFHTPTFWERHSALILLGAAFVFAETFLLAFFVWERRRHARAEMEAADQIAYEQTMSELTADAVRHAPDESAGALENALARVGRFAGASSAVLVQYPETPLATATTLEWTGNGASGNGNGLSKQHSNGKSRGDSMLEIPLVADGRSFGALELYRFHESAIWPEHLVSRLDAAGRVIAGAMARSRASRLAELRSDESRRQAAHVGRVAMVGELAAAVAHELRQPLSAIRANAEAGAMLVSNHPTALAEAKSIFDDIVADDARACEVVERIRTFLRSSEYAPVQLDLNDVCRQVARLLSREAMLRYMRLDLFLDSRLPQVKGDPAQLQQVVINLVNNGLDAVAVSTEERAVTISTTARDSEVEISVRDTGPGVDAEVMPHLFEPFYSTKSQGLGMGLVVVRAIVERHHGRVLVENGPRGGAVFKVLLPRH